MAIRQQNTYGTVQMTHNGKSHEALGISHSAIYPDAYWTPVSNFIEGVYHLNGDIDITETAENVRRLLAFVKLMLQNAAVVAEGDNPSHDLPFDLQQFLVENGPLVLLRLEQPLQSFTPAQSSALFEQLASAWTYVDDVAFKHRVFYADYKGRMRPLQMTLTHKRAYDDFLDKVSPMYAPKELLKRACWH